MKKSLLKIRKMKKFIGFIHNRFNDDFDEFYFDFILLYQGRLCREGSKTLKFTKIKLWTHCRSFKINPNTTVVEAEVKDM